MTVPLEVSLGLWQDRPPGEVLTTAALADRLGYRAVWVGEMATWDAFALAARIGAGFTTATLVVGPLAVDVRDPMTIAVGTASVAALTGRPVAVALGTSSPVVVERWHGRRRSGGAVALDESAQAVRQLLDGDRSDVAGSVVGSQGYRLRLDPPRSELVIAAFGPRAVRVAAARADRMVLNLIDPDLAGQLIAQLEVACREIGRSPRPRVALWVATAADPSPAAATQLNRSLIAYLAAPGYGEMFTRAGFGDVVALARSGVHPSEVLARLPDELHRAVGLVGDGDQISARMEEYRAAGVDDLVIVPSATDDDPAGEHTLGVLAQIAGHPTG